MSIKTFKPTTPSRRHMTVSGFDGIDKHAKPEASLTEVLKKNAGRNSYGRPTVRHRGGGEQRKYRIIDCKRDKVDMEATVLRLEYDPNRSANIALVQYEDGEKRYIIAPVGLAAGEIIVIDSIKMDSIKTKDFRAFLTAVKADGKSLVVTPAKDETIVKSARNIPGVITSMANLINVYDILNAKYLVLDKEALAVIEEVFA